MAIERGCVSVAETADQARRTFDVGEHERDRARWQSGSPSDHLHSLPRPVSATGTRWYYGTPACRVALEGDAE